MNTDFLPQAVIDAAQHLDVPVLFPWPTGTWAQVSFLAFFVCYAPPHLLMVPFTPRSAARRQDLLRNQFKRGAKTYVYRTGRMVARLIHLLRFHGVRLPDITAFLLHALLLLVQFRRSKQTDVETIRTDENTWILVATMIAVRTLKGHVLEIWDLAMFSLHRENPPKRFQGRDAAIWRWSKHKVRNFEACFLDAVQSGVWISPQDVLRAELSLKELGLFDHYMFDDWDISWGRHGAKTALRNRVTMPAFRPAICLTDDSRATNAETDQSTYEHEQKEDFLRSRRESLVSSSTFSVEIITSDECTA